MVLVEATGDTINKYDLMGHLWPGAVVEETTLQLGIVHADEAVAYDDESHVIYSSCLSFSGNFTPPSSLARGQAM
jgi:hypothetical protein